MASAACPSQSGYLAITPITLAAVIWDADSRLSQCHHGARLCLCMSVIRVLTPRFFVVTYVISGLFFVSLCFENNLLLALDFLHLPCWDWLELFPFLVHCCSCIRDLRWLRHKNIFVNQIVSNASSKWNLCMQCDLHVLQTYPLRALWSSWVLDCKDSTRRLVDSWDSTSQPWIVLGIFWDAISCFAATFVVLVRAFLLHGMAAAISLVILVIRNHKVNFSQSSSIVEFWLLVFPFLFFSTLSGFSNLGPYFWPYMIWSGSRLNFCQSPSRYIPWEVSLSLPFSRIWQASVRIDIPIVIDKFLLHDVQISVSRFCDINVFQWNRECFFFRHMELNSKFHCDDDRTSHLESTRSRRHLLILSVETLPVHLEVLNWNLPIWG